MDNKIYNWVLRRAGAGITIQGKNKYGEEVKIPNVCDVCVHVDGIILANANNKAFYELQTSALPQASAA